MACEFDTINRVYGEEFGRGIDALAVPAARTFCSSEYTSGALLVKIIRDMGKLRREHAELGVRSGPPPWQAIRDRYFEVRAAEKAARAPARVCSFCDRYSRGYVVIGCEHPWSYYREHPEEFPPVIAKMARPAVAVIACPECNPGGYYDQLPALRQRVRERCTKTRNDFDEIWSTTHHE